MEQAKALPAVGVLAGTPWQSELARLGFTNVKPYTSTPAMVAALVKGDVAAGYGPKIERDYAWRLGKYPGTPVVGTQIHKLEQFLAMSKDSPSIKVADWQDAFGALQQDGTFDRIYASYFGGK